MARGTGFSAGTRDLRPGRRANTPWTRTATAPRTTRSANPDFNFRQFRSNLVLRWEYVPGSALFVVWSQGRTGYLADGSFDYRARHRAACSTSTRENVFLVKFSYCFQL